MSRNAVRPGYRVKTVVGLRDRLRKMDIIAVVYFSATNETT